MRLLFPHLLLSFSLSAFIPGIIGIKNGDDVDQDFGRRISTEKEQVEILDRSESNRVERQVPFR